MKWLSEGSSPKLIFRATQAGFNAMDFHTHCDNQGPTLIVTKSTSNNILFGGYTPTPWNCSISGQTYVRRFVVNFLNCEMYFWFISQLHLSLQWEFDNIFKNKKNSSENRVKMPVY